MRRSLTAVKRNVNYDITTLKRINEENQRIEKLISELDGNVDLDQTWIGMSKRHFKAAVACARRSVNKKDNF